MNEHKQTMYDSHYTSTEEKSWPINLIKRRFWMAANGKQPYAPWADPEIAYKWSKERLWRRFETADQFVKDRGTPNADGYSILLQKETREAGEKGRYNDNPDPYALVDGDDVIDPVTGEAHPAFKAILNHLGATWVEISQSGAGAHALYKGQLPEGIKALSFDIDDEPWGANDEIPGIEIYDGGRVTITTGEHVVDTPDEIHPWNDDIVDLLADIHSTVDREKQARTVDRDDYDLSDYEPKATSADETTDDIRDLFAALDRLTIDDVRTRTRRSDDSKQSPGDWTYYNPGYRTTSGGRSVHSNDGQRFHDFKHEQSFGLVGLVAAEHPDIDVDYPWNAPTGQAWFDTVEKIREMGNDIPKLSNGSKGELVLPVPIEIAKRTEPMEIRRMLAKRGVEWPTVDTVRNRLETEITDRMRDGDQVVIRSPTGSGKTYGVSTEEWKDNDDVTGPVIHAHKTKKARDQAAQMSADAGVDYAVLRGRKETCSMAAGDHDDTIKIDGIPVSDWIDYHCDTRGMPYHVVHQWIEDEIGEAPCEGNDHDCPSKHTFENIPRHEDSGNVTNDVVHCTLPFLKVPSLRMHTNIVIDEKPSFEMDIPNDMWHNSINKFVEQSPAPINSFAELVVASKQNAIETGQQAFTSDGLTGKRERLDTPDRVKETARRMSKYDLYGCMNLSNAVSYVHGADVETGMYSPADILDDVFDLPPKTFSKCFDTDELIERSLTAHPSISWYRDNTDVHSLAGSFVEAIWNAEKVQDGTWRASIRYEPPRLDAGANDEDGWNEERLTVVLDQGFSPRAMWSAPTYTLANSVVGLDASASEDDPEWSINVERDIPTVRILDEREAVWYRLAERKLSIVQIGDNTQPATSDRWAESQSKRMHASLEGLNRVLDEPITSGITSLALEGHLQDAIDDNIDSDTITAETMHYGATESRNDFAGESYGYLFGTIDPGDQPVLDRIAALGYAAEPEMKECPSCGGCGCSNCTDGEVRARGRGFVGRDARQAERVLANVRENSVIQAAGRYARDAEDPNDRATVFVHTDVLPDEYVDYQISDVTWTTTGQQRDIIRAVMNAPRGMTAKQIAFDLGIPKRSVLDALSRAEEKGVTERRNGVAASGADLWVPTGEGTEHGVASWDAGAWADAESRKGTYESSNTWVCAITCRLPTEPFTIDPDPVYGAVQSTFDPPGLG